MLNLYGNFLPFNSSSGRTITDACLIWFISRYSFRSSFSGWEKEACGSGDLFSVFALLNHIRKKEVEQAEEIIQSILDKKPEHVSALLLKVFIYKDKGLYEQASLIMKIIIKLVPNEPYVLVAKACISDPLSWPSDINALCTQALKLRPGYTLALLLRGATNFRLGNFDNALADLSQALEQEPEDDHIADLLSNVCFGKRDYSLALKYINQAMQQHADIPRLFIRGSIYAETGQLNEAMEDVSEVIRQFPLNADLAKDREIFRMYTWSLVIKGWIYFQSEKYEEARDALHQSLEKEPTSYAFTLLGWMAALEKEHRQAIECYTKALAIDPANYTALSRRGEGYQMIGDRGNAIVDFHASLQIQPSDLFALTRKFEVISWGWGDMAEKLEKLPSEIPSGYEFAANMENMRLQHSSNLMKTYHIKNFKTIWN